MAQRQIKLYSAQKNKETGNGYISKAFNANLPNVEELIKEARDEQKKINAEYKKTMKDVKAQQVRIRAPVAGEVESSPDDPSLRIQAPEIPLSPPISKPSRTPFNLILDKGTGNTVFILGSSKMGKSTALMRIYDKYYANNKYVSTLWTVNPQIPLYKGHKKLLKAGVWNDDAEDIIKQQKKIQTGTKNKYAFLNMFDDVINVRNNTLLDNLILTYRNSNMSSIISLQYSNLMSKCGRANCNNILAFGFNTDESIEVVIKTFLTGYLRKINVKDLGDQINWYKSMTSDHGFIYIRPADGVVSFHKFSL